MLMLQSGTKSAMCASKQTTRIDKSLGLRLSEIRDIKNSKMETHCERQT